MAAAIQDHLDAAHLVRTGSYEAKLSRGELYKAEKVLGDRTDTGAKKLLKLSPRQKQVVALHLQGVKNADIARVIGYDQAWVCTILADPLVQPYIDKFNEMTDRELAVLKNQAVDTLRNHLSSPNEKIQQGAADKVLKATGAYAQHVEPGLSAGDVIAAALAGVGDLMKAGGIEMREVARIPIINITAEAEKA